MSNRDSRSDGGQTRRIFLKRAAGALAGGAFLPGSHFALADLPAVAVVVDPEDLLLQNGPAVWAIRQLLDALKAKRITPRVLSSTSPESSSQYQIVIARSQSVLAGRFLGPACLQVPDVPEALGIIPAASGKPILLI